MTHLGQIAQHPHPIGSDEAIRVREYLVEQLRALGGEVQVEQAIGTVQYGRNVHAGRVNNIIATYRGEASSRAVMLVAHYDSVPEGPGAGDDGAGLVVILEAIRALRAGPPIKNDLVVLFTDGEEARGLLGAQAYAASHPDLKDRIGLMVNLEARGSSGPGLMFETSNYNGALIREFAGAAPYPMATSLMAAIYKLLPNNTDFTPLKEAGLTGLNFAFLETYESYHTKLDTIQNLDPRSVQHLGANVVGVIQHFGNLTLPLSKETDLVYFNWFGSRLFIYPVWFGWAIAVLAPLLFAIACIPLASPLDITFSRGAAAFASFFLQLLVTMGGTFAAFVVAKLIAGEFLEGDTASNKLLFAGVLGMGLGFGCATQRLLGRKLGFGNLTVGQLLAVSLLTLSLCWFLVGGSYVLEWPLIFAMIGMLAGPRLEEPARSLCYFAFLIPALLILVPLGYMFFVSLLLSYLGLAAASFLLTILLVMSPTLSGRLAGRGRLPVVIIFAVSAFLIGAGIRLSRWSAAHPRADTLIYSFNADNNKAKWISYDLAPDSWTSQCLGPNPGRDRVPDYMAGLDRPVLNSDAAVVPVSAPFVATNQKYVVDGEQTVTLQIASTRGARTLLVRLPGGLKVSAAGWSGNVQPVHDNSRTNAPWTFRFYNAPPEGASLEFRFEAQSPIRVWIADTTPGLPTIAPLIARPDDTTPGYGSDVTLVATALDL
jgi:hypothetical protein